MPIRLITTPILVITMTDPRDHDEPNSLITLRRSA
jgi:hypothetical protein